MTISRHLVDLMFSDQPPAPPEDPVETPKSPPKPLTPAQRRRARERALLRTYGLSLADVDRMLAAQGHACAICGAEFTLPSDGRHLGGAHIDHDHVSGRVRGLLCKPCNTGLGMFGDEASTLRAAISYLGR